MSAITSLPFTCPGPGNYELTGNFSQVFTSRAITPVSGCRINLGQYSIINTSTDAANATECIGAYPVSDVEIIGGGADMGKGFMFGVNLPPSESQPLGGENIVIRDGQWGGCLLRAIRAASPNGRCENVTVRNIGGSTTAIPMGFEMFGNWIRKNLLVDGLWANDPEEEMVAFSISQTTGTRTQSYSENLRCVQEETLPGTIALWTCSDEEQPVDVIDGLQSVNFARVLWLGSDTPTYHPYSFRRGVVGIGYTLPNKYVGEANHMLIGAPDLMVPGAPTINLLPVMTAQTTDGVTITGNSIGGGQYDAWHVADGGASSYVQWNNGGAGYCEVELATSAIVTSYAFGARIEAFSQLYAPKSWTVKAWDGSAWQTFDTQSNVGGWSAGENRTRTVTSPISTTKYRFDFSASQSGTYLQWRRLKMWA